MVALRTIVVAGIHYLIHPQKLGTITATINPDAILPVTLLATDEIFGGELEQILKSLAAVDDVFIPEFGGVLIEKNPEPEKGPKPAQDLSQEVYQMKLDAEALDGGVAQLPSGPYILYGPNVYQAWRLYDDEYDAFASGVVPEDVENPDAFVNVNALSPNAMFKSIPVPSRLYHRAPSNKKPLSGVRVSISDAFKLNGIQTTLSSRAWTSVYASEETTTSDYVRKLIDLGAIIVGKTKVGQLGGGEDWIDVQMPWNPRGDGYQSIKGSSAAAGSATAGYYWLQHAFGEDAIGGVRDSAAASGIYSLRPTFSNASLSGMQHGSSRYDTLSLTARSLAELQETTKIFYTKEDPAVKKIIYLDDLMELPKYQSTLVDGFVKTLEDYLKTKATRTSLDKLWVDSTPEAAKGKSLKEYLKDAPFRSFCYDYVREYSDFQIDYVRKFDQEPFLEAAVKFRWDLGQKTTEDEYTEDLARLKTFKRWFDEKVVSDGSTVVVLPYAVAEPEYRFDKFKEPEAIEGIKSGLLAPVLGAPHLIVPFSQVPYDSKVTARKEQLPISASILGAAGSDASLVNLVKDAFDAALWMAAVNAGKTAF